MGTNKQTTNSLLDNLYIKPVKDKGINTPHFPKFANNYLNQADLLFLPHDGNYKYALVVVDAGSGLVDARPITDKSSGQIIRAFDSIYKGKILKIPKVITVDPGTEFKGDVGEYLENDLGLHVKTGLVGRHRQQAFVENKNKQIGKLLFKRMTAEELLTEQPATAWAIDLPNVIKIINEKTKKKNSGKSSKVVDVSKQDVKCAGDTCNLIEQGTKVRVALDVPRDVASGARLHGKFREGDIRWNIQPRTVMKTLIAPGSVPLYAVDDGKGGVDNRALYTKNQLQIIPKVEHLPGSSLIRGNKEKVPNGSKGSKEVTKFVFEKIVDKKKEKNKIFYLIKWKGFNSSHNTWEPRTVLIKDIPDAVKAYEKT